MITGLLSRLRAGQITRDEYFSRLDRVQESQQQPSRAWPSKTKASAPVSPWRTPSHPSSPPFRNNPHLVDHQYHWHDERTASSSPSPRPYRQGTSPQHPPPAPNLSPSPRVYQRAAPPQPPPPALNLPFQPPHRPHRGGNRQAPYQRGHDYPRVAPSSTLSTGRFANPRVHQERLRQQAQQAEQGARYDNDASYEEDDGEEEWQQLQQYVDPWYSEEYDDDDYEVRPPQRYMDRPFDARWREDAIPPHMGDRDRATHSAYWNPRPESLTNGTPSTNSRSGGYTTPHSGVNTTRSGINSSSYSDSRAVSYLTAQRQRETEDPALSAWNRLSSHRLSSSQRTGSQNTSIPPAPAWFASSFEKHDKVLAPQLDLPPFLERNNMWNDLRESKLEMQRLAKEQDELAMCQAASRRGSAASGTGKKRTVSGEGGIARIQASQSEQSHGQHVKRHSLQKSLMKRSASASFISSQGSTTSRLYLLSQPKTSTRSSRPISHAKKIEEAELSACTFFPNVSRSRRSFAKTQTANPQRAHSAPSSLFYKAAPVSNNSRSMRDPKKDSVNDESGFSKYSKSTRDSKKDSLNDECVFAPIVNQPPRFMHSCRAYLKNNVFDRLHWTKSASSGASNASQPTQSGRTSTSRGSGDTLRSFLQRQNDCDFMRAERLIDVDNEAYADAVYTPEINARSRYLAERRRQAQAYTHLEHDAEQRLSATELSQSVRREDRACSGENHTFAPQINRRSSCRPSRGSAAMHDDHEQKLHRTASRQAQQSMLEEEEFPGRKFTFEPTLTTRGQFASGRVPWRKSTREYAQSVAKTREHKRQRAEFIRLEQEKKVDMECTFRPEIRCKPVGRTTSQDVAAARTLYRSLKGELLVSKP